MARGWNGKRVRRIVAMVLHVKGTTCHLCGMPGADSADHDPPRSVLVRSGVPDPDALVYLHPAHRVPCNTGRGARPITPALKAELLAKRLAHLGLAAPSVSPRFLRPAPAGVQDSCTLPPPNPAKTDKSTNREARP